MGPGQDTEARDIDAPDDPSRYRDLTGGWFDAGDQNKYVTFAEVAVHELLSAYEENPAAFQRSSDIPESDNGVPDILDEVKVETDWLLKMSDADGYTILKMGNNGYDVNAESPPSANADPRYYYGADCSAAALANAGMLAHAAVVFGDQPGLGAYADTLAARAQACYAWARPKLVSTDLDTDCDDGRIVAGDADRSVREQYASAVVAAVYLRDYRATAAYDADIVTWADSTLPVVDDFWFAYTPHLNDALLSYMDSPGADEGLAIPQGGEDRGFVRFRDLAMRRVELQAVAVVGNVAARDHDRPAAPCGGPEGERRRRNRAAIERVQPGPARRRQDRRHDAGRRGA